MAKRETERRQLNINNCDMGKKMSQFSPKLKQKTLIMHFPEVQIVFSALGLNYIGIFISILYNLKADFFPEMI